MPQGKAGHGAWGFSCKKGEMLNGLPWLNQKFKRAVALAQGHSILSQHWDTEKR